MTPEEKHLWYDFLERFPKHVRRQHVIGNYIVDFVCFKDMTVIELDGRQHLTSEMKEKDAIRDDYLKGFGFQVLRYPNRVIWENFSYVANDILEKTGHTLDELKPVRKKKRRMPKGITGQV